MKTPSCLGLLPKDRTILEREVMEVRPYDLDEQGHTIRDLIGMRIKAVVVYLDKSLSREREVSAGSRRSGWHGKVDESRAS